MGNLYIVATPIGNLEDITLRAQRILEEVDLIAAEDTRNTPKLLQRYNIKTKLISLHQHSRPHELAHIIDLLKEGKNIALVSDAGTPGIADPGQKLIEQAVKENIAITPLPGASAVTTLLSISGLPTDQFTFLGFIPKKKGKATLIKKMADLIWPIVLFISPYQLIKTLTEISVAYPNTEVVVGRELTKKFEEINRGPIQDIISHYQKKAIKGEFTVIIYNCDTLKK